MEAQTHGGVAESAVARRQALGRAVLAVAALAAVLIGLRAILPLPRAFGLLAVLVWFAMPGVVLGRRLYRVAAG